MTMMFYLASFAASILADEWRYSRLAPEADAYGKRGND